MADNIELDVGTVATDQLPDGSHAQIMKIADGADGGTQRAPVTTAFGLGVDVKRFPADPFGTNNDAAAAAGAIGSISAKLRAISRDLVANIVLAAGSARIGKVTLRNSADSADIDPLGQSTFEATLGEVQASPTANTVLDRLKAIATALGAVVIASQPSRAATVDSISAAQDSSRLMNGLTPLTPKFFVINRATSGDGTAVVAAVPTKKIRVTQYTLVCAGSVTVTWKSATAGPITGAMPFGASGGVSTPEAPRGLFETVAGEGLVLNLGGAVQVSGHGQYVEI